MTRKFFDCKKCHTHLVSFIKHHGLFVSYIIVANLFFYSSRLMSKFATGFLGKNPQWKFGFPSIFLALRFDLEFEKEIWESGLSTTFPQQINTAVRNRAKKTVKALLPARGALQDVYMAGKLTHRRQVPRRGKTKWQHRLLISRTCLLRSYYEGTFVRR